MPICAFSRSLCVRYIHCNNIIYLLVNLSGNKYFLIYNYYIQNYILPYRNRSWLNQYILSSPYIIIVIRISDAINLAYYIYSIMLFLLLHNPQQRCCTCNGTPPLFNAHPNGQNENDKNMLWLTELYEKRTSWSQLHIKSEANNSFVCLHLLVKKYTARCKFPHELPIPLI